MNETSDSLPFEMVWKQKRKEEEEEEEEEPPHRNKFNTIFFTANFLNVLISHSGYKTSRAAWSFFFFLCVCVLFGNWLETPATTTRGDSTQRLKKKNGANFLGETSVGR